MIGISGEDLYNWNKFVLSCDQGNTPQVKSDGRRAAIAAVDAFVKRYQATTGSVYFVHEASIGSSLALGNAGLSEEQKNQGYVATICSMIQSSEDNEKPDVFQDIFVTKEQLKNLGKLIENFLENLEET